MFANQQLSQNCATNGHGSPTEKVIVLKMHYQAMKSYSYLVIDPGGREAVIVDPAGQMEKIEDALTDAQARLSGILVTHSHPDHIQLASPIAEAYDCPIWMSREEIAASGFAASHLFAIDMNPWPVGEMLIEPIFTPGHTPGCTCYKIGDNLFTGDVLFAEGCGICPDTQAAYSMFASLQNLKRCLKPQTIVFPGHSYGNPPGHRLSQIMKDNIYLQFSDRESFAAFRLRKGQDRKKLFAFS